MSPLKRKPNPASTLRPATAPAVIAAYSGLGRFGIPDPPSARVDEPLTCMDIPGVCSGTPLPPDLSLITAPLPSKAAPRESGRFPGR